MRGYKVEKTAGFTYLRQTASDPGPFKSVIDEEGTCSRAAAVAVCTDTAAAVAGAVSGFLHRDRAVGFLVEVKTTRLRAGCC